MIPEESVVERNSLFRGHDVLKLLLIGSFAIISLLVTLYGIMVLQDGAILDKYYLLPHLYIIPIILVALWYPRRGMQVILLLILSIVLLTGFAYIVRHGLDPVLSLLNAGIDVWIVAALALIARSRVSSEHPPPITPSGTMASGMEDTPMERQMDGYVEALRLPDEGIRQEAVKALADFQNSTVVEILVGALQDSSKTVREEAVRSLGRIQCPDTIPPLLEVLKDENRMVREQAVKALGNKGEMSVPSLLEALDRPDWHVRMGAAIALRIVGDERAVDPLIRLLSDENRFVRREAVKSLGRLGDPRAQTRLLELREDPDQTVRLRVDAALMKIHGRHFTVDETNISIDEIEKH